MKIKRIKKGKRKQINLIEGFLPNQASVNLMRRRSDGSIDETTKRLLEGIRYQRNINQLN
jgi:hypothetical protein